MFGFSLFELYFWGLSASFAGILVMRFILWRKRENENRRSSDDSIDEFFGRFLTDFIWFYILGSLLYAIIWPLALPYIAIRKLK